MLQIGEVADRVGLSLRTVRFYEEQGLLAPAARSEGGFRLYTETQVERLALIKRMKPLGFTVEQMADLLAAHDTLQDPSTSKVSRTAARERIATFADLATERCEHLRKQLDHAEAFARQLQAETARTSASASR
jgi:DNA-binding transcriptional MerR regulator